MSKADGLKKLTEITGIKVPPFFVVTTGDDPACHLERALDKLKGESFAVRSSFCGEDGAKHSFAGQFETYLWVKRAEIGGKIEAVRRSANGAAVEAYRRLSGLDDDSRESGNLSLNQVIVQEMVDAQCAGVCFSDDPLKKNAGKLVSSVSGTAEDLVGGLVDGSTFHLPPARGEAVPAYMRAHYMRDLDKAVDAIQKHFGYPVDVEWAIDKEGTLFILQARAITTLPMAKTADKEQEKVTILDASNIQESYPGISSPLTYSFARRAYCHVYQSLMRLFGVSESTITANSNVFPNMIAYHEGKIYYNLGNWYTLVALLPFYKTNRQFMEGMMGVKKPLQSEFISESGVIEEQGCSHWLLRAGHSLNSLYCLGKMIFTALTLDSQIKRFYANLESALQAGKPRDKVKEMSLLQLAALYNSLEEKLLNRWDAPVVNDFFAMVAYGILSKQKDIGAVHHYLRPENDEIISGQPPKLIAMLAELIKDDELLLRLMESKDIKDCVKALSRLRLNKPAARLYDQYLERFGDRSLGELKLESACIEDDPSVLLATVAACARNLNLNGYASSNPNRHLKADIKKTEKTRLTVRILAGITGKLIARRENLRFERTRVFGLVRLIFNTMGARLEEAGILESGRDIFYLTVDEIFDFINGAAATDAGTLKSLVQLRRRQSEAHPQVSPLRLKYSGAYGTAKIEEDLPGKENLPQKNLNHCQGSSAEVLVGTAASAGVVRGRVRVISDPASQTLLPGEILVAERTDPGWVVHFAVAAGLVTNHGSLLSHTAIVSRELGLPCVVALADATQKLKTGDLVEIDGNRGQVKILEHAVDDLLLVA